MVKKVVDVFYKALDGKKFEKMEDAFEYERNLRTKCVYLGYTPDTEQNGRFENNVVVKVIGGHNFAEDLIRDFCYREFGQQIYENEDGQLVRNWSISGTSTVEEYKKDHSNLEVLVTIDVRSKEDKEYEEKLTKETKETKEEPKVSPKGFCENCRDITEYTVSDFCKVKAIKSHTVNYVSRVAKCNTCGGSVFVPEIRDYNLKKLNDSLEEAEQGRF